ncbi:helix-turn-helix domain-containing protein [Micromonospora echinaurantiaca]|uniref:helix-turn-helix domain-containing protein n=1 Tax=Micromonospora echinaurantiaca TaxID=47857 RepID=UPI00341FAFB9
MPGGPWRVVELTDRRFGVAYTLRGVSYLLHRVGYSLQVRARRAAERDPAAIATWQRRPWPAVKAGKDSRRPCTVLRRGARGSAFRTRQVRPCGRREARPGRGRTPWSRCRARAPVGCRPPGSSASSADTAAG